MIANWPLTTSGKRLSTSGDAASTEENEVTMRRCVMGPSMCSSDAKSNWKKASVLAGSLSKTVKVASAL